MTGAATWERIYRDDIWQGSAYGSLSGPGSGPTATQHVGPAIVQLCARLGVTSVIDAACGDSAWLPPLPGYLGIDRAPHAIRRSRARHPDRRYVVGDLRDLDARADLVILRDVVQHLTLVDGVSLVKAARRRGRWLLASTYRGGANVGCSPTRLLMGWAYDADLERQPFGLGLPLEVIPDGYAYDGDSVRDPRKYLALWSAS